MPETTAIQIAIVAVLTLIGIFVGWIMRGKRAKAEKMAVSAGWQEQINAQRTEHDRLTDQNKGLMEQIGQYQASNSDAKNRARELSEAVQEAYARRDQLQREITDVRAILEVSMNEKAQLKSDVNAYGSHRADMQEKDTRITRLQLQLDSWQNRLPPLIDKYRQRDEDAIQLEADLAASTQRIGELEAKVDVMSQTRIEAVRDQDALTNGRDASNDPIDDALEGAAEQPQTDANFDSSRDRLQQIKGVGPAIEKTLNEMGIFRFQQIAEMSEFEIDRIAKRLKGFHSRIYREDWIGQARNLHDQDNGV